MTQDEPKQVFTVVSANFAVFSSAVIILGVLSATILLYGYLGVFDWRLIWLVEYTDVLKVGLVAIAFISGFSAFVWNFVDQAYKDAKSGSRAGIIIAWICAVVSAASFIYSEQQSDHPRYALVISFHLSILMLVTLTAAAVKLYGNLALLSARVLIFGLFFLTVVMTTLGATFGYYTRDAWRDYSQVITLEKEVLQNARLVMLTSRHAIIYVGDNTIVVPVSEIKKIEVRTRK